MNNNYDTLRPAAANMLRSNMGLRPAESVLFLSDVPQPQDWSKTYENLSEMCRRSLMTRRICEMMVEDFPQNKIEFLGFPATWQNGTEPSKETVARMLEYDVVIMMTSHSLSHTNARQDATRKGIRVASMPGIEADMFNPDAPMSANYDAVCRESNEWAKKLSAGKKAHVTTPYGTDLKFSIEGRDGFADTGLFRQKGEWGNLPAGEAFTTPVEGSAEGRLVVPAGWYPKLEQQMTFLFKDGYVVSIEGGGAVGDHFRQTCQPDSDEFKHRRNCAELGIGTNPFAKKTDNVLEAEKIKGTIHIAIGDSIHMGGLTESDLHEDFVLHKPTLVIDGTTVID